MGERTTRSLVAYQTTLRRPTETIPFAFAYGMNAIIPTEIDMPTTRMAVQGQRDEIRELERHLDWANKVRGNVVIRMTSYQQRVIAHYDKKA